MSKMYSFLVDDNREHKKAKDMDRNVVVTISHNEYENLLLNIIRFRHFLNKIQSEDRRIRTDEINQISLFCFHDKINIQTNGYDKFDVFDGSTGMYLE